MAKSTQIEKELSDHSDVIGQVAVWGHKMLAEFGMDIDDCVQEVRIACIEARPRWAKAQGARSERSGTRAAGTISATCAKS